MPELLSVQDVADLEYSDDATSQILHTRTCRAPLKGTIVTVRLRIRFLEQWQPCLVLVAALCKVKSFTTSL